MCIGSAPRINVAPIQQPVEPPPLPDPVVVPPPPVREEEDQRQLRADNPIRKARERRQGFGIRRLRIPLNSGNSGGPING